MLYGERFNTVTHAVGAILAAAGAMVLVTEAARTGDVWKTVSVSVYATSLVLMYLISSLYHGSSGATKALLHKLDHCAIYLLIAGSYTPFTLVTLRDTWGWPMFGAVWALALFGIGRELRHTGGALAPSLAIYVTMGWLALLCIDSLIDELGSRGAAWLAAGGLSYTAGIGFFVTSHRVRHGHGIWHLFVLGGSACHYIAVLFYVL